MIGMGLATAIAGYRGVVPDRAPLSITGGSTAGGGVTDAAGITRDQWQHFLETYRPVEEDVLRSAMQTDFQAEGDEAGRLAAASSRASRGILARNLRRVGTSLTGEERSALARRQNIGETLGRARAENTTRRGLSDSRTNLLASIVGIGRGVANTASAGLHSVADMAGQREALHRAQKEQTRATNLSMGAQAAALALAFI